MRISTIQQFNSGVRGIQDNYSNATRTQEQISSGKRILTPADDPVATVRLLQLSQESNRLEQFSTNMTAANNSLTQEEAILNSVNNALQRIREIAIEAGDGSLTDADRQALASELGEREEELYNLFNSRNARGEYLFGGYQSSEQPFVKNPDGSYSYQGDEGQRSIQIAGSKYVAINDNGKDLFVNVANVNRVNTEADAANTGSGRISLGVVENKSAYDTTFYPQGSVSIVIGATADSYEIVDSGGNPLTPPVTGQLEENDEGGYTVRYAGVAVTLDGDFAAGDSFSISTGDSTPGSTNRETRSVLETVALLRSTLEDGTSSTEDKLVRRDVVAVSLENLDNAMNKVLSVQTTIGARMNVIESTLTENEEVSLINTSVTSELQDLDYAEALSRLSLQSVVLEASQQSFVRVSGLSLFNLL
ncbi:MAG TPA: flagellar hook-associated protein 3 [Pseudomonas sp.]|jgi:flagellar hook-associated protein 3 FlgL|nr:flagellar hook-associated protein 3 [Pseudomonadales bacterium]MEB3733297.1 flagellar hook-associated protein FlgL [Halopseudomonas pachastrellae]HCA22573.1 flagellar hook-associated protein 3 [Pseudomonas sp.]MBB50063.1 flagellar hook-associated protein 3 [Pseudomonadales bacterium]MBF77290.1 flagellar hook-associated protein 3 [Pseudomonadales bacterium]|tara:strand:- start:1999 stop:3258 length:1260 start_codon:yes stop_codon:yes gene_type:complete